MPLFTRIQYEQLLRNGSPEQREKDHVPVVKLLLPGTGCAWLLTELDPDDPLRAFGLCDLGMGVPDLGYVDLAELAGLKLPLNVKLQADPNFTGKYPLSVYAKAARECDFITEFEPLLQSIQGTRKRPGFQPG
jgi:hypothetical protein